MHYSICADTLRIHYDKFYMAYSVTYIEVSDKCVGLCLTKHKEDIVFLHVPHDACSAVNFAALQYIPV
jgi:hypothetical protein